MTNSPAFGFLDNPHAPDVFADAATAFFLVSGNLRITFEALRVNHVSTPGPVNRLVIGRFLPPKRSAQTRRLASPCAIAPPTRHVRRSNPHS
jgi:hypothetical protein